MSDWKPASEHPAEPGNYEVHGAPQGPRVHYFDGMHWRIAPQAAAPVVRTVGCPGTKWRKANSPHDGAPLSAILQVLDAEDAVLINGARIAGEVLRSLTTVSPPGTWFRVVDVGQSVTIECKREQP